MCVEGALGIVSWPNYRFNELAIGSSRNDYWLWS